MSTPTAIDDTNVTQVPPSPPTLQERFDDLALAWLRGTAHLSSTRRKREHPAFRDLVALGQEAVPCLLRAIADRPLGHWYLVLEAILGCNAASSDEQESLARREKARIRWGKAKGPPRQGMV